MGQLGMRTWNGGGYLLVRSLGYLVGAFLGGVSGGVVGRQGVWRGDESRPWGVSWFCGQCGVEGGALRVFRVLCDRLSISMRWSFSLMVKG